MLLITTSPITRDDARAISRWRYEPTYSIYDGNPNLVRVLLDPRHRYQAVHDERGDLVGYYGVGEDARVSAGVELNLYPDGPLDVGLGMRPDLTGRGLGRSFVEAVVEFATQTHAPESLRLTVAAFNRRAIRVYEKCGFTVTQTFGRSADGEPEWVLMHKKRV